MNGTIIEKNSGTENKMRVFIYSTTLKYLSF